MNLLILCFEFFKTGLLSVGGGLNIMNSLQLSVNYNWNFGPVANLTAYKDRVEGIERRNARCLQISLAYIF